MINWNVDLWDAREKPEAPSYEIEKRTNFVRLQLRLHTPVGQSATRLSSVMFDKLRQFVIYLLKRFTYKIEAQTDLQQAVIQRDSKRWTKFRTHVFQN